MDAKSLRTLNKYQNALKKRFAVTKKSVEISLDTLEIVNNLYKEEYKDLNKRKLFRFFFPLDMLVDVADNIEAKSKVLKSNYLEALENFNQNKKVIHNALGLKLIKETDDLIEVENIKTKDILRLGKIKK